MTLPHRRRDNSMKSLVVAALVATAAGAFCLSPSALGAPAADSGMSSQSIADAIEDEFIFDRSVPANAIDINVMDGIATLTGDVNNILSKRRAERIAETVKGVRAVVNRIDVQPTELRSDAEIETDVKAALLADPAADSYELNVRASDGIVTLSGTVQSWTEKQLAEKVVMGVKGVTAVHDKIDVEYGVNRSDAEIKPEIEKALRWDVLVDDGLIDVKVNDGNVKLTGTVGSAAEKRQARYDAWVAGVRSVDDSGLNVEGWARDEELRENKYVDKPAAQIEKAIEDALLYDPRVMSFDVTPEVIGSAVTLRGQVDNLKAKRAAGQVARNTVGVTSVTNRLKVRPVGDFTDSKIARDVREALLRDPFVNRYDVDVAVVDGTVYLTGTVDSYFEKGQADDVASKVKGVVEVLNRLDVAYGGPFVYDPYVYDTYPKDYDWYDYEPYYSFDSDAEIKDEIEDELWWSPFVDSDDVTVSVMDRVATLNGTVDTWSERQAAEENAYEGGAVWVDNELDVQ